MGGLSPLFLFEHKALEIADCGLWIVNLSFRNWHLLIGEQLRRL
jgi:hypothetical protein